MKERMMRMARKTTGAGQRWLLALLLGWVLLLLMTPTALAQETPTQRHAPDTAAQAIQPTADTYIDSANPDEAFADEAVLRILRINSESVSLQQRTFLHFDLANVRPGAPIRAASLSLFQTVGSDSPVLIYQVNEAWEASATTWNNQPTNIARLDAWEAPAQGGQYITYAGDNLAALVRQWVDAPAQNFGLMLDTSGQSDAREFYSAEYPQNLPPLLQLDFAPIRVCYDADCTRPAVGAEIHNLATDGIYRAGEGGYVEQDGGIAVGDSLWVRLVVERLPNALRYLTSGEPQAVTEDAFILYPGLNQPELRLILQKSLLVRNLQVSAQWNLEGDPAYQEELAQRIIDASDHFYRFTDGQFALGRVIVYQNYDRWNDPATDLWLHTSNTMRPLSYIKGEVITPTVDPAPDIDFIYEPGNMYIGSHWNRYGAPPTQPLPPGIDVSRDWAAALAHELGHYLLGQFDAYIAVQPDGVVIETFACTGSAMGFVYTATNQAFIWDAEHWASACGNTLGAYNVQRTEWETIQTWFDWAQQPETTTPYTGSLPLALTTVQFMPPTAPAPLVNQIFDLDYQNDELPSGEARAFLLRDVNNDGAFDRILDQGRPPENVAPAQVTLTGAQAGDRLCVIDIDTHADPPATPRHQFGCRVIEAGDSVLPMRRDLDWAPIIQVTPLTVTEIGVSVTQPVVDGALRAILYPEHDAAPTAELALTPAGDAWSGVFTVSGLTPAAFVQVWVEGDEQPLRREAIIDYGIGGGAVPGPKQKIGFAPVTSSDGKAFFLLPAELSLGADEFVAIQSMAGILPLTPATRLFGQSYRLIALPPDLAALGSINIYLGEGSPGLTVGTAAADVLLQEMRSIYFWDGATWEKLPTTFSSADDGGGMREVLASAASRGVGVYAVLTEATARLYLPLLTR